MACAAMACRPPHAGVEKAPGVYVELAEESYAVSGSSAAEARKAVETSGPTRAGKSFDSFTDVKMSFGYSYTWHESHCSVVNYEALLQATRTLPRWEAAADVPSKETREFYAFIDGRTRTEERRLGAAVDLTAKFVLEMEALELSRSCDDLKKLLDEKGEQMRTKLTDALVAFDEKG